jgi:tRNA1(Val) A37 N6-methylase TrmN6
MHPQDDNQAKYSQDGFLGEKLRVRQPLDGFRSGHDAVLLAAASAPPEGGHIVELGSGSGVASLCFAARRTDAQITGLEIDPKMLALAQNNAEANDLGARVHFKLADLNGPFNDMHLVANSYDEVIANPPFYKLGNVPELETDVKARALIGTEGTLDTWVKCAAALAKARGHVTFIHRADALAQLLTVMQKRLGDLHVLPVLPKPNKAATRVLVRGRRDARAPVTLLPPLVLQNSDGEPSQAAESVLRHGAALAFGEAGR